ncbi:head decoration protein [Bradyrhizobium sp. USDA 4350]
MQTFTEARHAGEFILSELDGHGSRDNVVIALNQTIIAGAVLGAAAVVAGETSSVIVGAGNTGNGVLTLANPATSQAAVDGDYLLTCTAAAANAGTFSVQTPDGREIGPMTVAVAFNKEIKFTLADGATDFVVGDSFKIRVGIESPSDYQYAALNPAAADGTQNAAAVAIYAVTTDGTSTAQIAVIDNDAELIGACLTWPAGITAPQKAEAILQLRKQGVKIR